MYDNDIRMKIRRQNKNHKTKVYDTIGYFVAYTQNDRVHIGYFADPYGISKKDATKIAFGRAEKCYDRPIKIPQSLKNEFLTFYKYCQNRKSFQGKYIIDNVQYYIPEYNSYIPFTIDELQSKSYVELLNIISIYKLLKMEKMDSLLN